MFTVKPVFFDDFVCKADKCTDTCCAGWEIDIDKTTMNKYNSVIGSFSERLHNGISFVDDVYSFRLKEDERCWFLAENGLCDIYSHLGKDCLCDICREHPRFYNLYDNAEEKGLGLCCERVCELLFDDCKSFELYFDGEMPDDDYAELFTLRKLCYEILNKKEYLLCDNICSLLLFASETQKNYFNEEFSVAEYENKADLFKRLLFLNSATEPVNSEWIELLKQLEDNLDLIVDVSDKVNFSDVYYEKLLCYVIYRHLIESAFCGNFIGGITFSVSAVIFVHIINCLQYILSGTLTVTDIINSVKLWSKQIEYSQENTDMLIDKTVGIFFG